MNGTSVIFGAARNAALVSNLSFDFPLMQSLQGISSPDGPFYLCTRLERLIGKPAHSTLSINYSRTSACLALSMDQELKCRRNDCPSNNVAF